MGLHLEWGKKDGTGKGVKEEEGRVMGVRKCGGGGEEEERKGGETRMVDSKEQRGGREMEGIQGEEGR